ncbi:hypothetical protein ALQ32_102271 [Pseudomonas syringae pv. tagetis]|uniref:Uncharacterized protein n=1 Tax=Pseudomonas syringae pv. tagetis TaxID=129140 RepID=A0A3M3YU57_9PSED|nr:Unknown protein sequence [Pseudomonas amygdali pv. lachrymans]RMO85761.1 hypothetical protein ALQ32_102271 [Pseudomonas syringae pv. tagetis]
MKHLLFSLVRERCIIQQLLMFSLMRCLQFGELLCKLAGCHTAVDPEANTQK